MSIIINIMSEYINKKLKDMDMVCEAMADLRRRFFVAKGARSVLEIAEELRINRQTLARFMRQGYVSMQTVAKIEGWVLEHERQAHA
jgi:hypothetical protein